jgi:hypothetical protein
MFMLNFWQVVAQQRIFKALMQALKVKFCTLH